MPEMMPSPAAGGAPPSPQGAQQPQQAPMGVSSATGPTPNRGYEAAAQQRLGVVIKILGELIPLAGATSDIGSAAMDAIKKLSKFAPPGSTSQAGERNQIEGMMLKNTQNQQMQQQMRPGAQAQPGAAAPPRAA